MCSRSNATSTPTRWKRYRLPRSRLALEGDSEHGVMISLACRSMMVSMTACSKYSRQQSSNGGYRTRAIWFASFILDAGYDMLVGLGRSSTLVFVPVMVQDVVTGQSCTLSFITVPYLAIFASVATVAGANIHIRVHHVVDQIDTLCHGRAFFDASLRR